MMWCLGGAGTSLSTGGDASTYIEREACLSGCMYGWTYVCTSREGKGKDMSVCMHSRSRHPSQQRIASHRRSSTRVPPASHSRTRQFCMERTMDLLYHIQLRTPSRPNGRPRQPFLQALLPSIRTCRLPMLSLRALLAAAFCFFPASCLAGPPELPSDPRDSFREIPIC
ncbi:hypothetical protein TEQG_04477 [Trichophyton equinum CBS 127.97]|uniref:Uncharacterized protein n=1 Tax=Trichophyton equinum (strain ATCC MYA-4606 / CBS 127.97) TaxID=559882 RepID=F2PU98_TRIEC|nr:hypothetical protein TEQG_04477 [Trichophyton equinum CBS 127.97]